MATGSFIRGHNRSAGCNSGEAGGSGTILRAGENNNQPTNSSVFNGEGGDDRVEIMTGGTFDGGGSVDTVGGGGSELAGLNGGIFNGGDGNDIVTILRAGENNNQPTNSSVFNGEGGDDRVEIMTGGTFDGGAGNDRAFTMFGGIFNGGADDDGRRHGRHDRGGIGPDRWHVQRRRWQRRRHLPAGGT